MTYNLKILFTIFGISSASGLVYINDSLFIIADNSSFLYQYDMKTNNLSKIKLYQKSEENTSKKDKLDFESITLKKNKLHIFGSGSTEKRNIKFSYNLGNKEIKSKKLSDLYDDLIQNKQFNNENLNIEGSFYHKENLYLLQRGNGNDAINGIFVINKKKEISFTKINLPIIKNIQASFTDMIFVDEKIYFLAAAENTDSTYNDGEIKGSLIGCMNLKFQIEYTKQISETNKFEGLTLLSKSKSEISFLLCEDNDTEKLESKIYQLTLKL